MYTARIALLPLSLVLLVAAGPVRRASFTLQNGLDAQALNAKFEGLTASSSCNAGDDACIDGGFAQCVNGQFVVTGCAAGTECFGLPLVNKAGTSIACTTQADAEARIAATGATGGIDGNGGSGGSTDNSTSTDPSPTAAADPAPTPDAAASGDSTYTVVSGDTCIGIAQSQGTTVDALESANPSINSDCTNLQIGQVLDIPSGSDTGSSAGSSSTASAAAPSPTTDSGNSTATPNDAGQPAPAACATTSKRSISSSLTIAKRIAQSDLPAVAQSWQDLCLVSGGDIQTNDPCVNLAGINGINALLAGADPCAQQDNADAMIDFANSPGITNQAALIANAVAYRQHPRNALNINGIVPSTPFCQKAPRNSQLNGLVNGQLQGVDPGLFGGPKFPIVPFGDPVSCPFGKTPDVSTCTCQ